MYDKEEFLNKIKPYINNKISARMWVLPNGDIIGTDLFHNEFLKDFILKLDCCPQGFKDNKDVIYNIGTKYKHKEWDWLNDKWLEYHKTWKDILLNEFSWVQMGKDHPDLYISNKYKLTKYQLYVLEDLLNNLFLDHSHTFCLTVEDNNGNVNIYKYDLIRTDSKDIIKEIKQFQLNL